MAFAQYISSVDRTSPTLTIAGPGECRFVEEATLTRALGDGYSKEGGCRQAPEESVVFGDVFVCLFNYLLE